MKRYTFGLAVILKVVKSPLTNGHVNIKDNSKGGVIKYNWNANHRTSQWPNKTTIRGWFWWYISRLISQVLTSISLIMFSLTDRVMFFTNGSTVHLLITQGIAHLHQDIIVVETSQLLQVQIASGIRFPLSYHPFEPLPRLTSRRVVFPERQSQHLTPISLSE